MTTLAFNNGGILPNGGVVQFNSYGLRTSVPGTGVQTITVGGTIAGAPTHNISLTSRRAEPAGL